METLLSKLMQRLSEHPKLPSRGISPLTFLPPLSPPPPSWLSPLLPPGMPVRCCMGQCIDRQGNTVPCLVCLKGSFSRSGIGGLGMLTVLPLPPTNPAPSLQSPPPPLPPSPPPPSSTIAAFNMGTSRMPPITPPLQEHTQQAIFMMGTPPTQPCVPVSQFRSVQPGQEEEGGEGASSHTGVEQALLVGQQVCREEGGGGERVGNAFLWGQVLGAMVSDFYGARAKEDNN